MLYKRVPTLAVSWESGALTVRNYARGSTARLPLEAFAVLDALSSWRDLDDLRRQCGHPDRARLAKQVAELTALGLIEGPQGASHAAERSLGGWSSWDPSALYFHLDTKDVPYVDESVSVAHVDRQLLIDEPPELGRRGAAIALPEVRRRGAFANVLLTRRSWRRFGKRSLTRAELSTMLGLTWGTQQRIQVRENLALRLKTSPSGGACHSLQVYVAVARVKGLDSGLYSYSPDDHTLAPLNRRCEPSQWPKVLGGQHWTAGAAAVFFVTSVFSRVQWKYKSARAYRTVLLEAGHVCQTFCLVATWLKLAPFCTAAFADSRIERLLNVDGLSESMIYVMGVGTRPPGASSALSAGSARAPIDTDSGPRRRQSRAGRGSERK